MGVIKKGWAGVAGLVMMYFLGLLAIGVVFEGFEFLVTMMTSGSMSADIASLIQLLEDGGLVTVGNWMALEMNNVVALMGIFGGGLILFRKNKEQMKKMLKDAGDKLLWVIDGNIKALIMVLVAVWAGAGYNILTYNDPDGGMKMAMLIVSWAIVLVVGLMKVNPGWILKMEKDYKTTELGSPWDGEKV